MTKIHLNKRFIGRLDLRNAYKKQMPSLLPSELLSIGVGEMLGDATVISSSTGKSASLRFQQGYKNKLYFEHLFSIFKDWSWYTSPTVNVPLKGVRIGLPKSYCFSTFTHAAWLPLQEIFIVKGKKTYVAGTILKYLCGVGLSYWICDDGCICTHTGVLRLHTEGFTQEENIQICKELNQKFNLESYVVRDRNYWKIYIPRRNILHVIPALLEKAITKIPECMSYKLNIC